MSNFYPSTLHLWNMSFRSAEHAYQYFKASLMGDMEAASEIMNTYSPFMVKNIGGRVTLDDSWDKRRENVMMYILEAKIQQCDEFSTELISTEGRVLIEDTANEYWGRGKYGQGQNVLGKLLMRIRNQLCEELNSH